MPRPIFAAILLAACSSDPAAVDAGLELRTDRASYDVGAPIAAALSNRSGEDVFIGHCNHRLLLLIERRVGDDWVLHDPGSTCPASYPSGELRIPRGTTYRDSVAVHAAGDFRLRSYGRRASEDFGSLDPTSPTFTVRYPPD